MTSSTALVLALIALSVLVSVCAAQIERSRFDCMFAGKRLGRKMLTRHYEAFNLQAARFAINDKQEIAALWAHFAIESDFLSRTREYCADTETCPFKGYREYPNKANWCQTPLPSGKQEFYGRGILKIHWHCNYATVGHAVGEDLLNDPDLVATDINIAYAASLYFWMYKRQGFISKAQKSMSELAREGNFAGTTDRIAGWEECASYETQAQRVMQYNRARQCLNLPLENNHLNLYCGQVWVPDIAMLNETCEEYTVENRDTICTIAQTFGISGCCNAPDGSIIDLRTLIDASVMDVTLGQRLLVCPVNDTDKMCQTADVEYATYIHNETVVDTKQDVFYNSKIQFRNKWSTGYEADIVLSLNERVTAWEVALKLEPPARMINLWGGRVYSKSPIIRVRYDQHDGVREKGSIISLRMAISGNYSLGAINVQSLTSGISTDINPQVLERSSVNMVDNTVAIVGYPVDEDTQHIILIVLTSVLGGMIAGAGLLLIIIRIQKKRNGLDKNGMSNPSYDDLDSRSTNSVNFSSIGSQSVRDVPPMISSASSQSRF